MPVHKIINEKRQLCKEDGAKLPPDIHETDKNVQKNSIGMKEMA